MLAYIWHLRPQIKVHVGSNETPSVACQSTSFEGKGNPPFWVVKCELLIADSTSKSGSRNHPVSCVADPISPKDKLPGEKKSWRSTAHFPTLERNKAIESENQMACI